jgi:Protein of unknown function, DUF
VGELRTRCRSDLFATRARIGVPPGSTGRIGPASAFGSSSVEHCGLLGNCDLTAQLGFAAASGLFSAGNIGPLQVTQLGPACRPAGERARLTESFIRDPTFLWAWIPSGRAVTHEVRLQVGDRRSLGVARLQGHVPIGPVLRMLTERPAIRGISLPGMPAGSPGMFGEKTEPFTIYEIGDGEPKVYAVE